VLALARADDEFAGQHVFVEKVSRDPASAVFRWRSMKPLKSDLAALIAGAYLLLVLAVASPLVRDGSIHHGNGLAFLLALALTSPLSFILLHVTDPSGTTGWSYVIAICELGAGALLNVSLIYVMVAFIRKWWA